MVGGSEQYGDADLAALIDSTDDPLWSVDMNYALVAANLAARRAIEGRHGTEARRGMRPEELLPADEAASWTLFYELTLAKGSFQVQLPFCAGKTIEFSFHPIVGTGGPMGVSVMGRDITRLKQAEQLLRTSEAGYRSMIDLALDPMCVSRMSDGTVIECNTAFLSCMGYTRAEALGRTWLELNIWVDASDRQRMVKALRQDSTCRNLEAQFRRRNGVIYWGLMSASTMELGGVACILSVTRDISEAKTVEDEIRNLAFYDSLTGLPNRRLLLERLKHTPAEVSRQGRRRALLYVDLDDFKTLNDTRGHQTGDLLLQQVACRLSGCVRESDTVARIGGDEFIVMLEDLDDGPGVALEQARTIGEKILAAFGRPWQLDGYRYSGSCSIGITVFGQEAAGCDHVIEQADAAMYEAKTAGRNRLSFFVPVRGVQSGLSDAVC